MVHRLWESFGSLALGSWRTVASGGGGARRSGVVTVGSSFGITGSFAFGARPGDAVYRRSNNRATGSDCQRLALPVVQREGSRHGSKIAVHARALVCR